MICVKPASRTASSFASSGPARVMVSIPKWSMFMASLRLQMADDQLEGHAAEVDLGQRALLARLHRAAVDEDDAAIAQRPRGSRNVGRAQADADQAFVPVDLLRARRRLDQLQVELPARALEQRPLGQDAEVLAARQHREPEQVAV